MTIIVSPIEDSVSTLDVSKANPVPGTTMGDAMTALGNTKMSISADVPERPGDLPNVAGAPLNFVETDWGELGYGASHPRLPHNPRTRIAAAATSAWLLN